MEVPVQIIDDVPTLTAGSDISLESGEASAAQTLTFAYGADVPASSTLTVNDASGTASEDGKTLTFELDNGTLVLTKTDTGYSYVYTAKANADLTFDENDQATEELTFAIKDADNDVASQKVTVTITKPEEPTTEYSAVVDEANIVDANEGSISNIATVTADDLFGENSGYTITGVTPASGDYYTAAVSDGTLTYTLTARTDGGATTTNLSDAEGTRQSSDTTNGEPLTVTVQDTNGNTFTVEVPVQIIDDVPTVTAGNNPKTELTVDESSTEADSAVVVLTPQSGADGYKSGSPAYTLSIKTNTPEDVIALIQNKEDPTAPPTEAQLALQPDTEHPNVIHGMAGEIEIFTVSLNDDGTVSFQMTGNGTLKHETASGEEEDSISVGSVTLTCSVEDMDGDTASKSVDLDLQVTGDGAPPNPPGLDPDAHTISLTVDESYVPRIGSEEAPIGNAHIIGEETYNTYLEGGKTSNVDETNIASLFEDPDFGPDGPASDGGINYLLSITEGTESIDPAHVVAGFDTNDEPIIVNLNEVFGEDAVLYNTSLNTHDDQPVYLYVSPDGQAVYGISADYHNIGEMGNLVTGAGGKQYYSSAPVFKVTVADDGTLEMTQYVALKHGWVPLTDEEQARLAEITHQVSIDPSWLNDPEHSDDKALLLRVYDNNTEEDGLIKLEGFIQVQQQLTDADGDTTEPSDPVSINLAFEDDGALFTYKHIDMGFGLRADGSAEYRTHGQVQESTGADGLTLITYTGDDGVEHQTQFLAVFDDEVMEGTYWVEVGGVKTTAELSIDTVSATEQTIVMTSGGKTLLSGWLHQDGHWDVSLEDTTFRIAGKKEGDIPPDDSAYQNNFKLRFMISDGDGDFAKAYQDLKTGVGLQPDNIDSLLGTDGKDTGNVIEINGAAGATAPGDLGGLALGSTAATTYNICFILDTSMSMDTIVSGRLDRLDVANASIRSFIEDSVMTSTTKTLYNISICAFDSTGRGTTTITIDNTGDSTVYKIGDTIYSKANFLSRLDGNLLPTQTHGGTDYQSGIDEAATWFRNLGDISSAKGNLTYFLTDGCVAPSSGSTSSNLSLYQAALSSYATLLSLAANMQVNSIGFGQNLNSDAMHTLALFDNTTNKLDPDGTIAEIDDYAAVPRAGGYTLYYGRVSGGDPSGTWNSTTYPDTYALLSSFKNADTHRTDYYYVKVGDAYHALSYSGGTWSYTANGSTVALSDEQAVYVHVGDGVSTRVMTGDALSAAFESGFQPSELDNAGSDTIKVKETSGVIYGDTMNTDELWATIKSIAHVQESDTVFATLGFGSGYRLFNWMKSQDGKDALAGTEYADWKDEKTVSYLLEHAKEMSYETRTLTDNTAQKTTFYIFDLDGNVVAGYEKDGTPVSDLTGISIENTRGRDGGDDAIAGASDADIIFGQEGNDNISGEAGDDVIYGGTGDDVLLGGAGNDCLFGGVGEDVLFGDLTGNLEELDGGWLKDLSSDIKDELSDLGATGNSLHDQILSLDSEGREAFSSWVDENGAAGDDYLNGGAGEDIMFGGAGNDLMVYDSEDAIIDGGAGIDFLLTDASGLDLANLEKVSNVEVLLTVDSTKINDLTSIDDLAEKCGITLTDANRDGNAETMTLDAASWSPSGDGYTNEDFGLDLTTNLVEDTSNEDTSVIVFTIANGNS